MVNHIFEDHAEAAIDAEAEIAASQATTRRSFVFILILELLLGDRLVVSPWLKRVGILMFFLTGALLGHNRRFRTSIVIKANSDMTNVNSLTVLRIK